MCNLFSLTTLGSSWLLTNLWLMGFFCPQELRRTPIKVCSIIFSVIKIIFHCVLIWFSYSKAHGNGPMNVGMRLIANLSGGMSVKCEYDCKCRYTFVYKSISINDNSRKSVSVAELCSPRVFGGLFWFQFRMNNGFVCENLMPHLGIRNRKLR